MFVPSSQTFSPMVKGLNLVSFIRRSCAMIMAFRASSLACLIPSILIVKSCCFVSLSGWYAFGVYPISKSNGVFFVVVWGHEFLTYCASGSHSAHVFCLVPQYSRRYCSSDWLVRSLCPSVCGWYAIDMFRLTSSRLHSSLVNFEISCGPLSDMIFLGTP